MSEAPTIPTPNAPAAIPAGALYPADGGAAAAAAASTIPAATGADSVAASTGADSVAAAAGADSVAASTGADSGTAATGADSIAAGAGQDTVAAPVYEITLPEGFTNDATLMTEAHTVLAAAGVAPDKAQSLIDLFGKAVKGSADAQLAAHNTQQAAWMTEINALPEFTGPTRETSLASIGRLFDEYGTPEAKAALNAYGVGNNPALVKMMHKIASALTEGTPAPGGRPKVGANAQAKPVGPASLYENEGRGPTRSGT